MIAEIPGSIRRRIALFRESLEKKKNPVRAAYSVYDFSEILKGRLENPGFSWPVRPPESRPKVFVPVLPWACTPVPYYSIEIGRAMAACGAEVGYVWDPVDILFNTPHPGDISAIENALGTLRHKAEVLDLPAADGIQGSDCDAELREIVSENAIRFQGGELSAFWDEPLWQETAPIARSHLARIERLFQEHRPDVVLIPGGVYGVSALYMLACRRQGVSFTTYDSGPEQVAFAHDAAAAHMEDIGKTYAELYPGLSGGDIADMVGEVEKTLSIRRRGVDVFRLQPRSTGGARKSRYDLFVPLNFRSDTAALQRQKLFTGVKDWISHLLEWVCSVPDVRIAIRQHPCERIPEYRGTDDWPACLAPFRKRLGSRLRFVSAWDQVNSYDLIANAKVVLPYTSRVGIESAFLGVPVVLCTKCFYGDTDFVISPQTRGDYFKAIGDAVTGRLTVDDAQREKAAVFYYILETCAFQTTRFTPVPEDFERWSRMTPASLLDTEAAGLIIDCIVNRRLFPSLLHEHNLSRRNVAASVQVNALSQ